MFEQRFIGNQGTLISLPCTEIWTRKGELLLLLTWGCKERWRVPFRNWISTFILKLKCKNQTDGTTRPRKHTVTTLISCEQTRQATDSQRAGVWDTYLGWVDAGTSTPGVSPSEHEHFTETYLKALSKNLLLHNTIDPFILEEIVTLFNYITNRSNRSLELKFSKVPHNNKPL